MQEMIIYQARQEKKAKKILPDIAVEKEVKDWYKDCQEKALNLAARFIVWIRSPLTKRAGYQPNKEKFSAQLFFNRMARSFAAFSFLIVLVNYAPATWYVFDSALLGDNTSKKILQTAETSVERGVQEKAKRVYQPKYQADLAVENRLTISAIGVDTEIEEATLENYEQALKKGVWRVSDFGTPYDRKLSTILAAHRFGYLSWSNTYRRQNSFFNLPKLEVGDTIEIIWRQRRYVYEVYKEERGEEITDYSADLILYTCESLNSPIRIIKYSRLLEL